MSVMISLIYLAVGENIKIVMMVNVIISSVTCVVIYLLGKEIFNKQIGLISAYWSIIYVYFMVYIPRVMKENMLQLLIPLVILLMVYEVKKKKVNIASFYLPLIFTYLIHTDERYIIFIPVIFMTMIVSDKVSRTFGIKKFSIFFITVMVLSIPWAIRNYFVYERPVILTIRTEEVTRPLIDKYFNYNGFSQNRKITTDIQDENVNVIKQNSISRLEDEKVARNIRYLNRIENNNFLYNSYDESFQRFMIYWSPMVIWESKFKSYIIPAGSLKYNIGGMLTFGILLPFFLIGSGISIMRNKLGLSLLFFILIQSLLHIQFDFINPWPRYRYPVDSLVIIISIYGFVNIFKYIQFKFVSVINQYNLKI